MDIKKLITLTAFSIAMAYLETSVVVYLRALIYPNGFEFPLVALDAQLAVTEIFREAATVIMLLGAGWLAATKARDRFAWFIYCFAIWDIFYYVFLKVILDWPAGWLTWDLLFLIPVPWVGPVLAPVIVSISLIVLALLLIYTSEKTPDVKLSKIDWSLLILGATVIIVSFCYDYSSYLLEKGTFSELIDGVTGNSDLFLEGADYIPREFNWWIFLLGEIICLIPVVRITMIHLKRRK